MAVYSFFCPVICRRVLYEPDLTGAAIHITCGELDPATRLCSVQRRAHHDGRLAEFLSRVHEQTLDQTGDRCLLLGVNAGLPDDSEAVM